MISPWVLTVGMIVTVLGLSYAIRNRVTEFLTPDTKGENKPTIWWYVDDSQVNVHQWLDWGNRATREPNEPYLKICLARAQFLWGADFNIRPVIGRAAAFELLSVSDVSNSVPPALFLPWCRAAFLSKFGGLWLDGSVLPVGSGVALKERLARASVLMFGVDPDEKLATSAAVAPMAGVAAGWSASPNDPMWTKLATDLRALIGEGPPAWSTIITRRSLRRLWEEYAKGIPVDRAAEVSRDRYGRRLELDTLLSQTEWPDGTLEDGLWVPLPDGRDGLERATHWAWFLRMSPEQISESDFVWAQWSSAV